VKNQRVRLKPLPARQQARLERDVAELATLSTEELRKRARPLTAAERAEWERARRGRPRKVPGTKAARVLFTIDPELLKRADEYARRHGLTRAQLLATGLQKAISA
jgi:hypothetical protein